MKSILFVLFAVALFVPSLQAQEQEEEFPHFCTEITLDQLDTTPAYELPPGMVAKAVAFKPELGKYWKNGKVLRVRFLGGDELMRSRVRKYAAEWSEVANIQFRFIEKGDADLRVGFSQGMGTWSIVGTDALHVPQTKQTINFGWFRNKATESEYRATILHEFGHALGLLHEHQHPQGGIPWDKNRLYDYYQKTQGWNKALVDEQVLGNYNAGKTQYTRYDPYSIMHYPIPNSLTLGDFQVGMNRDLSPTDKAFMAKVYPKPAGASNRTETATTTTTRPTNPGTTSTRPTTSTTSSTKPRPSTTSRAILTIRDVLPESQKREQVWITIQGVTRTFVLDQSGNRAASLSFDLPQGTYEYEVRTKTTFLQRIRGRMEEKTLNGFGQGEVTVRKNTTFDLALGKAINERWFEVKLLTASK